MFVDLDAEDPALAPIAGRAQDVRERLQALSHIGAGGRLIRTHGDYHLGQTMLTEPRLGDPRLRGRAGAAAARAPPQALAAARRGGHAALVRLRRVGGRAAAAASPARRAGRSAPGRRSWRATTRRSTRACCRRARTRRTSCCRSSSWRRPSTSCATSSTTGPTGSGSPWRGSCACSTPTSPTSAVVVSARGGRRARRASARRAWRRCATGGARSSSPTGRGRRPPACSSGPARRGRRCRCSRGVSASSRGAATARRPAAERRLPSRRRSRLARLDVAPDLAARGVGGDALEQRHRARRGRRPRRAPAPARWRATSASSRSRSRVGGVGGRAGQLRRRGGVAPPRAAAGRARSPRGPRRRACRSARRAPRCARSSARRRPRRSELDRRARRARRAATCSTSGRRARAAARRPPPSRGCSAPGPRRPSGRAQLASVVADGVVGSTPRATSIASSAIRRPSRALAAEVADAGLDHQRLVELGVRCRAGGRPRSPPRRPPSPRRARAGAGASSSAGSAASARRGPGAWLRATSIARPIGRMPLLGALGEQQRDGHEPGVVDPRGERRVVERGEGARCPASISARPAAGSPSSSVASAAHRLGGGADRRLVRAARAPARGRSGRAWRRSRRGRRRRSRA